MLALYDLSLTLFGVTYVYVLCTGEIQRKTQERSSGFGGEQQKRALICDVIVCAGRNKKHVASSVF